MMSIRSDFYRCKAQVKTSKSARRESLVKGAEIQLHLHLMETEDLNLIRGGRRKRERVRECGGGGEKLNKRRIQSSQLTLKRDKHGPPNVDVCNCVYDYQHYPQHHRHRHHDDDHRCRCRLSTSFWATGQPNGHAKQRARHIN